MVLILSGCAQANNTDVLAPVNPYGPQYKVSVFVYGLADSPFTTFIDTMINDPSCIKLKVIERSAFYAEISCPTRDGAGVVANAFQSTAKQQGLDLSVSHSGDQVILRKLK